jgi:hypothetical protein
MKFAEITESVPARWNNVFSTQTHWSSAASDASIVDQDLEQSWERKAQLQWVRNDAGVLNGCRWFLWDKLGLGRPPSTLAKRSTLHSSIDSSAQSSSTLRLVGPRRNSAGSGVDDA